MLQVNELYAEGGLERDLVSPEEISEIEPALSGDAYLGGYFTPSDFTGDIHRYTVGHPAAHTMHAFAHVHALGALAEGCALCALQVGLADGIEKEGVVFKMGNAVETIEYMHTHMHAYMHACMHTYRHGNAVETIESVRSEE